MKELSLGIIVATATIVHQTASMFLGLLIKVFLKSNILLMATNYVNSNIIFRMNSKTSPIIQINILSWNSRELERKIMGQSIQLGL